MARGPKGPVRARENAADPGAEESRPVESASAVPAVDASTVVAESGAPPSVDATPAPAEVVPPVAPTDPALASGPSVADMLAEKDALVASLRSELLAAEGRANELAANLEHADTALREMRDRFFEDQVHFRRAWDRREAEFQNARPGVLAPVAAPVDGALPTDAPAGSVEMVPVVFHSSVMYRGRVYEPGEAFPFDPRRPPEGVSARFAEGVHFRFVPRA